MVQLPREDWVRREIPSLDPYWIGPNELVLVQSGPRLFGAILVTIEDRRLTLNHVDTRQNLGVQTLL